MIKIVFKLTFLLVVLVSLVSCETTGGHRQSGIHAGGPHGSKHRIKNEQKTAKLTVSRKRGSYHRYYYYPNTAVYRDPIRKIYYYISGKHWKVSKSLPKRIHLDKYRIKLKMKSTKPYLSYKYHRKKYPRKRIKRRVKKKTKTVAKKHEKQDKTENDGKSKFIEFNKNMVYQ